MQAPGKFNLSESRVFARWGFLGPLGTYAGAAILPGESRERTTEIRHVFLAPKDQCEIPLSFPAEMIGCLPDVIISPVPLISVSSSPRAPAPWPEEIPKYSGPRTSPLSSAASPRPQNDRGSPGRGGPGLYDCQRQNRATLCRALFLSRTRKIEEIFLPTFPQLTKRRMALLILGPRNYSRFAIVFCYVASVKKCYPSPPLARAEN